MKIKNIEIASSEERLVPLGGLLLVGKLLEKCAFDDESNSIVSANRSQPCITNAEILKTYIALLCQGSSAFESVDELICGDKDFFRCALGISKKFPSKETLRQRINHLAREPRMHDIIRIAQRNMLQGCRWEPGTLTNGYVPLDIDVSPFINDKCNKEGVSRTYKKQDGFAPIFAYLGTEGMMINCQFREGRQHSQKGTPEFLYETLKIARFYTDKPILVRLDSGNDAADNIGILVEKGINFLIKRNPRQESTENWMDNIKKWCIKPYSPRPGKKVYVGTTYLNIDWKGDKLKHKGSMCTRVIYEGIERKEDATGQLLLFPDQELNTWWTNTDLSDEECIRLYHQHGEMEQYHSEMKTDMDTERFPSGKFKTNTLIMDLIMIAYDILRMIGQESLKEDDAPKGNDVNRRRLTTVISKLIHCPVHVTVHAGKMTAKLGSVNPWSTTFQRLYTAFS